MAQSFTRRSFLSAAGAAAVPGQDTRTFRAGAAAVNITPNLGANIAGSMRNHMAEDVHDELYAKALVLDNGSYRLAFVVCDSCAIAPEVITEAKSLITGRLRLEPQHVLISATHSHSAPAAASLFQSDPDPVYQRTLAIRIADAVKLAINRLQPASIGWGAGSESTIVFNRRYYMQPGAIPADPFGRQADKVLMNPGVGNKNILKPAGPIDPEVGILGVQSTSGAPIAVLGSYALHYVGVPGRTISADYFGVWSEEMKRHLAPNTPFIGILANACSGNINNVNFMGPATQYAPFEKMREAGRRLAEESLRVWRTLRWQNRVELAGSMEWLDLGVRKPAPAEVAEAKRILPASSDFTDRRHIYARESIQLDAYPDRVRVPVQSWRIGSLGIATFPGEAFVELGLEVKAKSPFRPTFLIELANGYYGYIPTPEAHQLGGYETWRAKSSFLEVDASTKMVDAALRGLRRLDTR